MKMRSALMALTCLMALGGCGGKVAKVDATKELIVVGVTMEAVRATFQEVSVAFKEGCDTQPRTLSSETCQGFRSFGERFLKEYPLAAAAYETAVAANDMLSANREMGKVLALSVETGKHAAKAARKEKR